MNEGQKALINLSGVLQFLQMKKSFPAHVHGQSICFCPLQIIISMAILTCRYYCFPLLPFNELPCVPGVEGSGVLHNSSAKTEKFCSWNKAFFICRCNHCVSHFHDIRVISCMRSNRREHSQRLHAAISKAAPFHQLLFFFRMLSKHLKG